MKKKLCSLALLTLSINILSACPVCDRNHSKLSRMISHGQSANDEWDYFIVGTVTLIVLISLYQLLKYSLQPGEKESKHIKRVVLGDFQDEK